MPDQKAQNVLDEQQFDAPAVAEVDLLAQCLVAVRASTNAMLAVMSYCEQAGVFDVARNRSAALMREARDSASSLVELQKRIDAEQKNPPRFMRDHKKDPNAGV